MAFKKLQITLYSCWLSAFDIPSLVLDKANVSQLSMAAHAFEAFWVPALAHGPNHTSKNKFPCDVCVYVCVGRGVI